MARPLKLTLDLLIYDGSITNDPKDATKIKGLVQESDVSESFRYQQIIEDETVDEVIALPNANSQYLLIFCDQIVSIKLNGSSDPLTLTPKASGTKTPVFMFKGDITALSISNESGNNAKLDIICVNI